MPRFTVTISEPELERLIDLAQRERRDPREQAAMLIVAALAAEAHADADAIREAALMQADTPASEQPA